MSASNLVNLQNSWELYKLLLYVVLRESEFALLSLFLQGVLNS